MKAAFVEQTGSADEIQVGERPKPEPERGQLLVQVRAVAFNPIDLYVRSGAVAMPLPLPYILGSDFAGEVVALGEEASRFRVGDRVWGSNQGLMGRQGVASEWAAIDQDLAYPTPAGQSDSDAAAQALVGITAYLGLFEHGRLQSGETVYIPGGSGGVGSMAVQMAKAAGARVATSAGSPERVDLCRQLGADLALDYKTDDIPTRLREFSPQGFDIWFETQREPDLEVSVPLLNKRGRMLLIAGRTAKPVLPLGSFYPRDCSILGYAMFNASNDTQRRAADAMNRWVATGQLQPVIGRTFPLAQAAEAQRFLEAKTSGSGSVAGKVVLDLSLA